MKKIILILTTSLCLMLSCNTIPKPLQNSFTYCYDGKYSGIDTLININGYYKEMFIDKRSRNVVKFLKVTPTYYIDTSYHHFMFYDNGMFVYAIPDGFYDYQKKGHQKIDISLLLKYISEDSEAAGANRFYGNFWGKYYICGDTIKVQQMYKGYKGLFYRWNATWYGSEVWYKIIDKNTLLCINAFNLPITTYPQLNERTRYPITFVPVPEKPTPYKSWILKEKWFWCDEENWSLFMANEKDK